MMPSRSRAYLTAWSIGSRGLDSLEAMPVCAAELPETGLDNVVSTESSFLLCSSVSALAAPATESDRAELFLEPVCVLAGERRVHELA